MWIVYAILTILTYASFDFFVKKTSGKGDDYFVTLIINIVSVLPALAMVLLTKFSGKNIEIQKEGLISATFAGIFVGLTSIFFIKMFVSGVNLSVGVPLVRVGMIIISILLGVLLLKETLNLKQTLGIVLALIGMFLLIYSK